MVSGFFVFQRAKAGTIYTNPVNSGTFERNVQLRTYLYDESNNPMLTATDYRENDTFPESNMGKSPTDLASIVNLTQGEIIKVKFELQTLPGSTYESIEGKAKFFTNTPDGISLFDDILIPIGNCTVTNSGICEPDNATDVIRFGGFNADGTLQQHFFEQTFIVGEGIESIHDIYMRIDYTHDGANPTNTLDIQNGDCNVFNPGDLTCNTSTATQGYMNFKFEVDDLSHPELYLLPDTTVGYRDFRTGSPYQANGFEVNAPTYPLYNEGNYPTTPPVFDAGVIFEEDITLNTKAMFQGKDPNDPNPEHFRDDRGVVVHQCEVGTPTCFSVTSTNASSVGNVPYTTTNIPVNLGGTSLTFTLNGGNPEVIPNNAPFDLAKPNTQGEGYVYIIQAVDYSGKISQPIIYSFKTPERPEWDGDPIVITPDPPFEERDIEGSSFELYSQAEILGHVSYYRDDYGSLLRTDRIEYTIDNTTASGNCVDAMSIDSTNKSLVLNTSIADRYQCHGDYSIPIKIRDLDMPGFNQSRIDFTIFDTPAFEKAEVTIGSNSPNIYNDTADALSHLNAGNFVDGGNITDGTNIQIKADFYDNPDGGDIFVRTEAINATYDDPVVTGPSPYTMDIDFGPVTMDGGDASTPRLIEYYVLRSGKLSELYDNNSIFYDPTFPTGDDFYNEYIDNNPDARDIAEDMVEYFRNEDIGVFEGSFRYKFKLVTSAPELTSLDVVQVYNDETTFSCLTDETCEPGDLKYTIGYDGNSGGLYDINATIDGSTKTIKSDHNFSSGSEVVIFNDDWRNDDLDLAYEVTLHLGTDLSTEVSVSGIQIDYDDPEVTWIPDKPDDPSNVTGVEFQIKSYVDITNSDHVKQRRIADISLYKRNTSGSFIYVASLPSPDTVPTAWVEQGWNYTHDPFSLSDFELGELDFDSEYKVEAIVEDYYGNKNLTSDTGTFIFSTVGGDLTDLQVRGTGGDSTVYTSTNPMILDSGTSKDFQVMGKVGEDPWDNMVNFSEYNVFYSYSCDDDVTLTGLNTTPSVPVSKYTLTPTNSSNITKTCSITARATKSGSPQVTTSFELQVKPQIIDELIIKDGSTEYSSNNSNNIVHLEYDTDPYNNFTLYIHKSGESIDVPFDGISDNLTMSLSGKNHDGNPYGTSDGWDGEIKDLVYNFYNNFSNEDSPYYPPYTENWQLCYDNPDSDTDPCIDFTINVSRGDIDETRIMKKDGDGDYTVVSGTDTLDPHTYGTMYRMEVDYGGGFIPVSGYTATQTAGDTTVRLSRNTAYDTKIDTSCPGTATVTFEFEDESQDLVLTVQDTTGTIPPPVFIPNRSRLLTNSDTVTFYAYVPQDHTCPVDVDGVRFFINNVGEVDITAPNDDGLYPFEYTGSFTGTTTHRVDALTFKAGYDNSPERPDPPLELVIDKDAPVVNANTVVFNGNKPLTDGAEINTTLTSIKAEIDENFNVFSTTTFKGNVDYTITISDGGDYSVTRTGVTSSAGFMYWSVGNPLPSGTYTMSVSGVDTAGNTFENNALLSFTINVDTLSYLGSFSSSPLSPASADVLNQQYSDQVDISYSVIAPNTVYSSYLYIVEEGLETTLETSNFNITSGDFDSGAGNWDKVGQIIGNQGSLTLTSGTDASADITYETTDGYTEKFLFAFVYITNDGSGATANILQPGANPALWDYYFEVNNSAPAKPVVTYISGVEAMEGDTITIREPAENVTPLFKGKFEGDASVPNGSKVALTLELCDEDSCDQTPPHAYKEIIPYGTDIGITNWEWNYTLSNWVYPLSDGKEYQATLETISPNGERSSAGIYKFNIETYEYDPENGETLRVDPENPDQAPEIEPVIADGQATYDLQIKIRDKYGNIIDDTIGTQSDSFEFELNFPIELYNADTGVFDENTKSVLQDYKAETSSEKISAIRLKDANPDEAGVQVYIFDEEIGAFVGKVASLAPTLDIRPFIEDIAGDTINPELGMPMIRDLDVKLSVRVTSENISRDTEYFFDEDSDNISLGNEETHKQFFVDAGYIGDGADLNCDDLLTPISDINDDDFIDNYELLTELPAEDIRRHDPYEICASIQDINPDDIVESEIAERFRTDPIVQPKQGDTPTGFLVFSPFWAYVASGNYEYIPAVKYSPLIDVKIEHLLYDGKDASGNEIWRPEDISSDEMLTLYQQATTERFRVTMHNKSEDQTIYFGDQDLGIEAILNFVESTASFEDMEVVGDTAFVKQWTEYNEETDQYTYSDPATWADIPTYITQEGTEVLAFKNINNALDSSEAIAFDFTAKPALTNPGILSSEGLIQSDLLYQIAEAEYYDDFIRAPGRMLGLNIIRTDVNLDLPGFVETEDGDSSFGQYTVTDILDIMEQRISGITRSELAQEYIRTSTSSNDPIEFTSEIDFESTEVQTAAYAYATNNDTVLYVMDANVIIGDDPDDTINLPAGANTIIVDGGNVIYKSRVAYGPETETFGVIVVPKRYNFSNDVQPIIPQDPLLETDYNEAIPGGNVFIHPDVTDISTNFFIQGALFNYDPQESDIEDRLTHTSSIYDVFIQDENSIPAVTRAVPALRHQLYIRGVLVALQNTMGGLSRIEPFEQIENFEDYNKLLDFSLFRIFALDASGTPRTFTERDTDITLESDFSAFCELEENQDPLNPMCERAVIIDRGVFKTPPGFDLPPDVNWTEISGYQKCLRAKEARKARKARA